ncbi:hypothetical protein NIES2135_34640 [Leptolyngbya boryana NIES-2135]|uniref:Uncharacterized protein n=2 Tax=Leptolyngbya group TaxID=3081713 RepID=A0A1Z4JIS2_LEPBY|nr:hypothetical protein LBWT_31370 [Leptolyngbya boryana IAM M-101]BAS63531.1 hypothetical protein LBDG_31370 [Leptolyngbya boryana dg5]BAY56630.1 hypothetical protein NIES2135_34640 [Leptolyngbya boryana NIES-2135]
MEEIELMMNFELASAPVTLKAWVILAAMLGLVTWGLWAEWLALQDSDSI